MPYVAPKHFLASKTIRFNGVLIALSAFLVALPSTIQTPPFSTIVGMLPQHWRDIIAAVISLIAAWNVVLRLVTKGPVTVTKQAD